MKHIPNWIARPAALLLAGSALTACDYIHDNSLQPCEYRLHFVYDYNMKFADAFQKEVENASLFICDDQGTFIGRQDIEGAELKANNLKLDLAPGTYYAVTWAGLSDTDYALKDDLIPGTTTLEELRLRTLRASDATLRRELSPLWHSLDTLVITRDVDEDKTISLAKNTNRLRLVLQDTDGNGMDVRDFTFRITADNGYMDYDNSLLADPVITYLPYHTENVNIAEGDTLLGKPLVQTVAVAEMNTMRLMDGRNYRLIVQRRGWEGDVLNINLNNYLLLTQMEGHDISAQEYLDRQDEYSIIFFLTPTYCPDCPDPKPDPDPDPDEPKDPDGPLDPDKPVDPDQPVDPDEPTPGPDPEYPIVNYACMKVQVKNWVIRLNHGEL